MIQESSTNNNNLINNNMKVINETSVLIKHGKEGKDSKGYYYEGP